MRHSIIVGGSKGLGREVTRQFAKRGDRVSVLSRNSLNESELNAGDVAWFPIDISNRDQLVLALKNVLITRGEPNYCIFLQRYRGSGDKWEGEFQVSLTATRNIIEYLSPKFAEEGDKGIVVVSSVLARYVGDGQELSYHVMKAGLEQLMRYYAVKLGKKGIRVNAITPFTFLKEESKRFYLDNTPLQEMYNKIVPLKRMATLTDLGNTVSFLSSGRAAFITGQNIVIDGGLSLIWPEYIAKDLLELTD